MKTETDFYICVRFKSRTSQLRAKMLDSNLLKLIAKVSHTAWEEN